MQFYRTIVLLTLLVFPALIGGCGFSPVAPTPPPTLPPPPLTPSPMPTPTPTSPPPVPLIVRFPETVSALEGVTVRVELPGLAQRDPQARVWAQIFPPHSREPFWESPLEDTGPTGYTSPEPVFFPLEALPGDWRLVISVHSDIPIRGQRLFRFRQEPIPFWDLAGQIPAEAHLRVPQAFPVVRQEGDEVAGVIIWQRGRERVELWWTPGPAEPLSLDTARMLVDATFPVTGNVEVLEVRAIFRGKRPCFQFRERWPEGLADAVVVQASSRRLCLLRILGDGAGGPSPLMEQIQRSFEVK